MVRIEYLGAIATAALSLALCQSSRAEPAAVFDAVISGRRVTIEFDELPKRAPLAPGQDFGVAKLGRDEHASNHVVAIRHRPPRPSRSRDRDAGFPIHQHLDGPQLETDWRFWVGWQYAF